MLPPKKNRISRYTETLASISDDPTKAIAPLQGKMTSEPIGEDQTYSNDYYRELDNELRHIETLAIESLKPYTLHKGLFLRRADNKHTTFRGRGRKGRGRSVRSEVIPAARFGLKKEAMVIDRYSLSQNEHIILQEIYSVRKLKKNIRLQIARAVDLERLLAARLMQSHSDVRIGNTFCVINDGDTLHRVESVVVYPGLTGKEVILTLLASKWVGSGWTDTWYEIDYSENNIQWKDRLEVASDPRDRVDLDRAIQITEAECRGVLAEMLDRQGRFQELSRRLLFLKYGFKPGVVLRVKIDGKWLIPNVKIISVEGFDNGSITIRGVEKLGSDWVSETLARLYTFSESDFRLWS